jgi:hypothetical protein
MEFIDSFLPCGGHYRFRKFPAINCGLLSDAISAKRSQVCIENEHCRL